MTTYGNYPKLSSTAYESKGEITVCDDVLADELADEPCLSERLELLKGQLALAVSVLVALGFDEALFQALP